MNNPFEKLKTVLVRVIERARVVSGATPKIEVKTVRKARLIYVNQYQLRITHSTVDLWTLGDDSIYREYHPTLQESLELMTVVANYRLITEKQLERALEFSLYVTVHARYLVQCTKLVFGKNFYGNFKT